MTRMIRIEGIRVKNYGVLRDCLLGEVGSSVGGELGDVVCLLGEHGSGKGTLLDVFSFLKDCLGKGVRLACSGGSRGGFEALVSGCDTDSVIEVAIRFSALCSGIGRGAPMHLCTGSSCGTCYGLAEGHYAEYTVRIGLDGIGHPSVLSERLEQRLRGGIGRGRVLIDLHDGEGEVCMTGAGGLRRFCTPTDALALGYIGVSNSWDTWTAGLRWFLGRWNCTDFTMVDSKRSCEIVHRYMSGHTALIADVLGSWGEVSGGLELARVGKTYSLRFREAGMTERLFSDIRISSGLRALLHYLLLFSEPLGFDLGVVDNFGDGLSPSALRVLLRGLRGRSGGVQVFLSTHNSRVVDGLDPSEVWVLEGRGGGVVRYAG